MTQLEKGKSVSLEELMVTTLAMADAVTKLLIKKLIPVCTPLLKGRVQGDYLNHYLARFSIAFLG